MKIASASLNAVAKVLARGHSCPQKPGGRSSTGKSHGICVFGRGADRDVRAPLPFLLHALVRTLSPIRHKKCPIRPSEKTSVWQSAGFCVGLNSFICARL